MPDHQIPRPLRTNRRYRWLLGGSTLSMLGSRLTTIAYPLLVLAWGGSPFIAGLAVCVANAPSVLVYIPAGALVDRAADPKRTLIIAEMARGLAIAVILGELLAGCKWIPLLIVVAFFEESFEGVATLAERRYVRKLVEPPQARAAQLGMEARAHVVVLVGRALGGLLFGVQQCVPFLADLMSFGVSVTSLLVTGRDREVPREKAAMPGHRNLWADVRAGWAELRDDAFAFNASLISACMSLISQSLIIVFLEVAHGRHASSFSIGVVLAMSGIGGLAGTLVSRRWPRPWNCSPLKSQPLIWAVMLFFFTFSGSRQVPFMGLVMMVLGLVGAMGNVELDTYLLVKVPPAKLARVTSFEMVLDLAASAVGPALGGLITELWGVRAAMIALCIVSFVVAFPVFSLKVPAVAPAAARVGATPAAGQPLEPTHESTRHGSPGGHTSREAALGR